MRDPYTYYCHAKGTSDLVRFSKMNSNENCLMYLVDVSPPTYPLSAWQIVQDDGVWNDAGVCLPIFAMAVNGQLFTPS